MKKRLAIAVTSELYPTIFDEHDQSRLKSLCDIVPVEIPNAADKDFLLKAVPSAEIVITSWGTAAFDDEVMAAAGKLKLITHAAGSVKPLLSDALIASGIRITSGAEAISYGVAEYCLGLMLLASKRAPWASNGTRRGLWNEAVNAFGGAFELYRKNIGIIGMSKVGRHLAHLLKNFDCSIFTYDPYCSSEQALSASAVKVDTLDELFSRCSIVSLNAPSTEETKGMLRGSHFALLHDGALFINTARADLINEPEFVEELNKGRFIACLDVTSPEPCPLNHPYRTLSNVMLTPHIAGVLANNRLRIGTHVADDIEAYANGLPLKNQVDLTRLAIIG